MAKVYEFKPKRFDDVINPNVLYNDLVQMNEEELKKAELENKKRFWRTAVAVVVGSIIFGAVTYANKNS